MLPSFVSVQFLPVNVQVEEKASERAEERLGSMSRLSAITQRFALGMNEFEVPGLDKFIRYYVTL